MAFSKSLRLAALLAVVHSFSPAAALAEAQDPQITPAPTPTITIPKRGDVAGGPGTPILSTLKYAYTELPYQVYPFQVLRGPQFGFNQCNSTTLGDNSNCQTLVFNGPVRCFSSPCSRVAVFVTTTFSVMWRGPEWRGPGHVLTLLSACLGRLLSLGLPRREWLHRRR